MTETVRSMTDVAPTIAALLGLPGPSASVGSALRPVVDDLGRPRGVAVLAPDAFGLFAWSLWKAEMPYLLSLHERRSLVLRSVMPSITPVNFAAMVTGTDVEGHGVRSFSDPFACETLFDVVRSAGGRSAAVGLAGYTGSELLGRHADLWGRVETMTDDAIVDRTLEIAEANGPDFLIVQLGRVDDVFHEHGPSSPAVLPMVRGTDARLERLVSTLRPLGYASIILADHGQHDVEHPVEGGHRGDHGTSSDEDCLVPCTWAS